MIAIMIILLAGRAGEPRLLPGLGRGSEALQRLKGYIGMYNHVRAIC